MFVSRYLMTCSYAQYLQRNKLIQTPVFLTLSVDSAASRHMGGIYARRLMYCKNRNVEIHSLFD